MKPRSATPQLPPDIELGVITTDMAALAGNGDQPALPEWVRILPRGRISLRDGRAFMIEPERLAARFAADGVSVPIDIDHAIAKKPQLGERADAVGWIAELQARDDGLYARIDLLDAGKAALAAKTHRYVSPSFHHDQDRRATWLHSVALVAAPALAMPAIAAADPTHNEEQPMSKAIAQALGLAETADEAACLTAITTLQAGSTGKVDKAVHDTALASLAAAQAQLTALQTADRKKRVDGVIEAALKDKKIVPAQKDHYLALCATDDGLSQVEALLAATPAGLQVSDLDRRAAPDSDATSDPVTLAAKATEHQRKLAEGGQTISIADAVIAVSQPKKEGRP